MLRYYLCIFLVLVIVPHLIASGVESFLFGDTIPKEAQWAAEWSAEILVYSIFLIPALVIGTFVGIARDDTYLGRIFVLSLVLIIVQFASVGLALHMNSFLDPIVTRHALWVEAGILFLGSMWNACMPAKAHFLRFGSWVLLIIGASTPLWWLWV